MLETMFWFEKINQLSICGCKRPNDINITVSVWKRIAFSDRKTSVMLTTPQVLSLPLSPKLLCFSKTTANASHCKCQSFNCQSLQMSKFLITDFRKGLINFKRANTSHTTTLPWFSLTYCCHCAIFVFPVP